MYLIYQEHFIFIPRKWIHRITVSLFLLLSSRQFYHLVGIRLTQKSLWLNDWWDTNFMRDLNTNLSHLRHERTTKSLTRKKYISDSWRYLIIRQTIRHPISYLQCTRVVRKTITWKKTLLIMNFYFLILRFSWTANSIGIGRQ